MEKDEDTQAERHELQRGICILQEMGMKMWIKKDRIIEIWSGLRKGEMHGGIKVYNGEMEDEKNG